MAEQNSGGERTEKPTAKKLKDAAREGDILQSRELATGLVVVVGAGWLAIMGPTMMAALRTMMTSALRFDQRDVAGFDPAERGIALIGTIAWPLAGVFFVTLLAAIAGPALLGSLGFRGEALTPKFSKLNPLKGIKRIFGMQGLIELGKSIAKVLLLGSVGFWLIWGRLTEITAMGSRDLQGALGEVGDMVVLACLVMAGAMMLIAGIDVPAQIVQRTRRLMMTKQEIKDEHKEAEGSPEIKGNIRRRQMEMLSGSMRKALAQANVVLVNPTHFAVALRYRAGTDAAPVVVAKGRDALAAAIREVARENKVPVLRYPELTRAVYFTSRIGQVVDESLYMAVARVLAYLFRVESRMASEADQPVIPVPEHLRFDAEGGKLD